MPSDAAPVHPFLFSIDLEDVRTMVDGGERYRERVPQMTRRYLEFLDRHKAKCTFFCVGRTVRENPGLVREIGAAGHELACHTDLHRPLTDMDRETFRDDLQRNVEALRDVGATEVIGFRAPTFSLVERTAWAYDVLAEAGFAYSSSVLPARSPLFGWEGFGEGPRRMGGVIELPITLRSARLLNVPFGGGVYFRVLPWLMVQRAFGRHLRAGRPVLSYMHPYDIDSEQERFMHPAIGNSRFYNFLLYHNRGGVFQRLERIMAMGFTIATYRDYVRQSVVSSLNP